MKKTLLLLIALITATIAFAYDVRIDGVYYNLNHETKTAEVTSGINKYSGDITIPEKVTRKATEYSVTYIGERAFYNCDALTSITIPNSVTSIGNYAFSNCSSLTSITIPNSVTYIGERAFYNCDALTSITIPNSVTSIGNYAFSNCSSLTSITIPNSVTSFGDWAFSNCSSLTSITIGNRVTYIGGAAFYNCSSLTSISIPNSVTSIEDWAFSNCSSLTSITIGNRVTYIGGSAFWGTPWLENQPDGCLYIGKCLYQYKGEMPKNTHIDVNEGTTMICSSAFRNCSSLTSITIPNSVTYIGGGAFRNCSSLTSISIPNSVTSIGSSAFYECSSLTSISIPNSITSIGDSIFTSCTSLTSITCLGSTPLEAGDLGANTSTCTLIVPKVAYNSYLCHAYWGQFLNIETIDVDYKKLTVIANNDEWGVVEGDGYYDNGNEATLTATANSGYRFAQWSDGNTDNPRNITVTQDSTFTAEFVLEEFALYATSASPELGYVKHTIEAIAIEGFEFDRWSDGNTENPRTIILTEDTKLYAYFKMTQGGNPVNIENSKISSANIYTTNGTLHIEGATTDYHILDTAGRLIYSGNASTLQLPRGIYLITMGGEVEKIVL